MEALTATGRWARLATTAVIFGLLLAGTVRGDDDHFPFGPFRMYATNAGPNAPAGDTLVQGVTSGGQVVLLNERNSGVRRAEVEGQLGSYLEDQARLSRLAEAYALTNPDLPGLVEVRVVVRWHGIRQSRPTGTYRDETIARWAAP